MVEFIKKNLIYILVGVIIILAVIIGVCTCLIINKPSSSKGGSIVCTDAKTNAKQKINYDEIGKITSREYETTLTYEDKNEYNAIKDYYKTNKMTYKANDKEKTIISTEVVENFKDENEKEIDVWVVTYQKTLESSGYTCK